ELADVAEEKEGELVFLVRQRNALAPALDGARAALEDERRRLEALLGGAGSHGAPGDRLDAGEELHLANRLGDVVVGARKERARDVVIPVAGRDEDDRRVRIALAHGVQDGDAVDVGQVPVEEIEIERLALQRTNERAPAIEVMAGMAGGLEPARGERCLVGVVFEIRDSHAAAVYRTVRSLLPAHSY